MGQNIFSSSQTIGACTRWLAINGVVVWILSKKKIDDHCGGLLSTHVSSRSEPVPCERSSATIVPNGLSPQEQNWCIQNILNWSYAASRSEDWKWQAISYRLSFFPLSVRLLVPTRRTSLCSADGNCLFDYFTDNVWITSRLFFLSYESQIFKAIDAPKKGKATSDDWCGVLEWFYVRTGLQFRQCI